MPKKWGRLVLELLVMWRKIWVMKPAPFFLGNILRKENNVLMVSVIYQKRALPIYWCLLEKEGSSNLAEQQKVLRPVIRLLKTYRLVVVGDREFHSVELASWLQQENVSFVLRQKQNTTFRQKRHSFQPLSSIPIHPGMQQFYTNINLTQKVEKGRFNLAVYWKRKYRGKQKNEARAAKLTAVRRR